MNCRTFPPPPSPLLSEPPAGVRRFPRPLPQLHFARGFRFVGHLVVIVFRILFVDLVKWGAVYLIIVPGFGIACFLLIRTEWVSPFGMFLARQRLSA